MLWSYNCSKYRPLSHVYHAPGLTRSCRKDITSQLHRYTGAVGFCLNYPQTEYGAPTSSSSLDRTGTKTDFENRRHVDLACSLTIRDTEFHARPCVGPPLRWDPLCSLRFMPDDVILTCDIDNAGQESTTNDVHHIYRQKKKERIPFPGPSPNPNCNTKPFGYETLLMNASTACTPLMYLPILPPATASATGQTKDVSMTSSGMKCGEQSKYPLKFLGEKSGEGLGAIYVTDRKWWTQLVCNVD